MQFRIGVILILVFFVTPNIAAAQDFFEGFEHLFAPPKSYVVHRTVDALVLDGKGNEKSWEKASWSDDFEDIEADKKPKPLYQTRVKMLWDADNLYVFAELEEPHIWAYYNKHDMIVYHENDFEVFIDPDRDTHNYYEFEVNAQNTLFDLFLSKPYRNGGRPNIKWDAKGFACEIFIDGTLNTPNDTDKKWCLEMRIPFASLNAYGGYVQPEAGDFWKMGFSRVQWQTEVKDGKYVKKINPETGKHYPEDNWVWSPQGLINMHFPERWGLVLFSDQPAGANVEAEIPRDEVLSRYLWLVYYKQNQFRREHKTYAQDLQQLGLPENFSESGETFDLALITGDTKYNATLETETGMVLSINEEGHLQQLNKRK